MLEYDDQRSGTFEPLKDVPQDKFVVLGLVSTKAGRLESIDDLRQKIRAASRYYPFAQLGVSPQCGFASSIIGNPLSIEDQRRKLQLVVTTAREVWA